VAKGVEALRGQFVVEIGVRQAWPFLTRAVAALLDLNGLTVTDLAVSTHNELRLVFDDGQSTLTIDAAPGEFTTQDIWWLGSAGS
jgi:hypothetical protein